MRDESNRQVWDSMMYLLDQDKEFMVVVCGNMMLSDWKFLQ